MTFSVCILSYVNDDSSTEGKSDGAADCSGGATVFGRKCTQRIPTVTYVMSCFFLGCSVDISTAEDTSSLSGFLQIYRRSKKLIIFINIELA